ncbi:MAG TPA: RNA methyltransferase [Flavobacteriaceae bacterium]|nr:RNA methyltransferase [Flavobacteriaceae bacterium]MCB9212474.1 RNA methyltransferase [Alteromonas sp.]HPF10537.1 RNA methyltransferase [Flavobacteriaceae bacterium]HQU20225.1 RNA methyltransferase [Flavobacteriaceae bacterium]HQU66033.1 RNA methyltransferase [Flavobacteriaceae bacterium]
MDLQLLEYLQTYLTERRKALFKEVLSKRTRHFTVVTEDVYQMHNTSAVIRSCDVFGVQDLHVVEARFGKRVDKEIAMGAQKWVNVYRHQDVGLCMEILRKQGYQIVATTPHQNATLLHEFDVVPKSALFFGTEKMGLSDLVMDSADAFLKIPMYGFTESLNISVSAAIILQEVVTRMRVEGIHWALSEMEQLELEFQWTKNSIKSIDKIIERFYYQKKS